MVVRCSEMHCVQRELWRVLNLVQSLLLQENNSDCSIVVSSAHVREAAVGCHLEFAGDRTSGGSTVCSRRRQTEGSPSATYRGCQWLKISELPGRSGNSWAPYGAHVTDQPSSLPEKGSYGASRGVGLMWLAGKIFQLLFRAWPAKQQQTGGSRSGDDGKKESKSAAANESSIVFQPRVR
ncbi:unnamed protein product [Musa banksii]